MIKKLLFIPLFIVLFGASVIVWFYFMVQPPGNDKNFKNFVISKGSSAGAIATNLEKSGFIRSALAFKIYVRVSGTEGKIFPGEYRLSNSISLFQIVNQLTRGPLELWVTIPEGLRREEVAVKFATGLDRDIAFVNEFLQASKNDEGKLFPDTYLFPKDASASSIVNKMVKTFDAKTKELPSNGNLSFNQKIILASIIERETKSGDERPVVAGIMMNRINAGMPLQVDATVQYALASTKCTVHSTKCEWWPTVYLEDLKIKSPYNTYENAGLPPAPIASPGLTALSAAFDPVQTGYFYYIHDTSGVIHYAKTLAEHNANVAKYLR